MESTIIKRGGITDEKRLYRFMGLTQFMAFVEKKQTYLTKVKTWEDTHELPLSKTPSWNPDGSLHKEENGICSYVYGQCWSVLSESDALWRIYSPNKDGLAIKTTAERFNLLTDIKYGILEPVYYYDDHELLMSHALEPSCTSS